MRAFLALVPDTELAVEIDHWRAMCWRNQPGAVSIQNLHLTLAFLGDVGESQARRLESILDTVPPPSIKLPLTQVAYRIDQDLLWLEPSAQDTEQATALHALVRSVRSASARAGIAVDKGRYRPHMTLARRVAAPASAPLLDPAFTLRADTFQLVSSRLTPVGPIYETQRVWRSVE